MTPRDYRQRITELREELDRERRKTIAEKNRARLAEEAVAKLQAPTDPTVLSALADARRGLTERDAAILAHLQRWHPNGLSATKRLLGQDVAADETAVRLATLVGWTAR